eukprot:425369_1
MNWMDDNHVGLHTDSTTCFWTSKVQPKHGFVSRKGPRKCSVDAAFMKVDPCVSGGDLCGWHIRSPFLATNRQSTTLTAFRLSSGSSCAGEVARLQRSELEHWQSNIDVD